MKEKSMKTNLLFYTHSGITRQAFFTFFALLFINACSELEFEQKSDKPSIQNESSNLNITPPDGGHKNGWCKFSAKKRNNLILQSAIIEGTPFVIEIQKRNTDIDEYECDFVFFNRIENREVLRIYSHVWCHHPANFYDFAADKKELIDENKTALYFSPQKTGLVIDAFWNSDHEESEPIYIFWGNGQPQHSKNIILRHGNTGKIEENVEMCGWSNDIPVFVVK